MYGAKREKISSDCCDYSHGKSGGLHIAKIYDVPIKRVEVVIHTPSLDATYLLSQPKQLKELLTLIALYNFLYISIVE